MSERTIILIDGKEYDDWDLEHKVETLIEAETIKQDKSLMSYLKPKVREKMKEKRQEAINSLNALRSKANIRPAKM